MIAVDVLQEVEEEVVVEGGSSSAMDMAANALAALVSSSSVTDESCELNWSRRACSRQLSNTGRYAMISRVGEVGGVGTGDDAIMVAIAGSGQVVVAVVVVVVVVGLRRTNKAMQKS
jgi:hypothetical protein